MSHTKSPNFEIASAQITDTALALHRALRDTLERVLPDLLEKTLERGWKAVVRASSPEREPSQTFVALSSSYAAAEVGMGAAATAAAATISEAQAGDAKAKDAAAAEQATAFLAEIGKEVKEM